MRYLTILVMIFIISSSTYSQTHEIGAFVGGSNFIGDVGSTKYISPNQLAIGGIYKWNRSPRHSFRFSAIYTTLEGLDAKSDDARRKQRGYSFNRSFIELSLGLEFNFLDFDLHKEDASTKSSPYLYTGVSYFNAQNFYFDSAGVKRDERTKSNVFGIPIVLGYKTTFTDRLIAAFEVGARYTFTDEIDGSVPDAEELEQFSFGNVNNNDWYVFTGMTLTFTFGRKPCECFF